MGFLFLIILDERLLFVLLILVEKLTITVEENFEDTKRVIRIRTSKKNKQHNGEKKRANNDIQNTTQKRKD